ncbi:MAG: helix-turn-helix transcriptional regulator [Kiritimatiellae bacterium]|nr:helix-turn-helix transcriptional regulator [Kiritimatiellia bacterium]
MLIKNAAFYYKVNGTLRWHSHDCYEFDYIVRGKGTIRYGPRGRKRRRIGPGLFYLFLPHEEHQLVLDRGDGEVIEYTIHCQIEDIERDIRAFFEGELADKRFFNIGVRQRYFFEELRGKVYSRNNLLMRGGIYRFLGFLYELAAGVLHAPDEAEDRHVEEALRMLQASIKNRPALDSLAGRLGLSRSYFVHLFKKRMGLPPMKYLARLKVEAACWHLKRADVAVHEVAHELGFEDEFYFSRTFKKWVGMSPRAYRERYAHGAEPVLIRKWSPDVPLRERIDAMMGVPEIVRRESRAE